MKITPINKAGDCRTGTLKNITVEEINSILGFRPNVKDDPYKVVNSWGFSVETENMGIRAPVPRGVRINVVTVECGIWDYKGSHKYGEFSTYGPSEVFSTLFSDRYISG